MKKIIFNCKLTAEAVNAYLEHKQANPEGMNLYRSKSASKVYDGYTVRETRTSVIVEELR